MAARSPYFFSSLGANCPDTRLCIPRNREILSQAETKGLGQAIEVYSGLAEPIGESVKDFIKTLVFTVLVPGTVTVYIPYRLLGRRAEFVFSGYHVLGVLPITVGAGFYFWCAWDFAFVGHGTPAPIDPPKALVSRGLYRVVRNPIYLAVLLVLFGESLFFSSWIIVRYAVLVWLLFHLWVVFYEEPALRKKFGRTYEEYCRAVWRWIPRIPDT